MLLQSIANSPTTNHPDVMRHLHFFSQDVEIVIGEIQIPKPEFA